jgi:hypothetical protein
VIRAHRDSRRPCSGFCVEIERGREAAVRLDLRLEIGDLLLRGGDGIGASILSRSNNTLAGNTANTAFGTYTPQ